MGFAVGDGLSDCGFELESLADAVARLAAPEAEPSGVWRLASDLGRRYAAVSGDTNPIHLSPLTSWLGGFRRPIVHGMWTHARALAALDATLRLYLHPEKLGDRLPTLRLLTRDAASIRAQGELLLPNVVPHYPGFDVRLESCQSQIGSGSLPVDRLPGAALTFTPHDGRGSRLEALAARWRRLPCPVIGRIYDGRLWLDLRCLEDETRFMEMLLR